jgi:hypothetical protein
MQAADLDAIYTQLAAAIEASGDKSELYLAMLVLRLVGAAQDPQACTTAIEQTLADLKRHEGG